MYSSGSAYRRVVVLAVAVMLCACGRGEEPGAAKAGITPETAAVPVAVAPVSVRRTERALKFVGTLFGEDPED